LRIDAAVLNRKKWTMRTRVTGVLAIALAVLVLAERFLPDMVWLTARQVAVSDIQPDTGLRFIGTLSDPVLSDEHAPTGARLELVERRSGGFFHKLDPLLGWSTAFQSLNAVFDAKYRTATHEVVTPLGPGQTLHADIAALGQGRFSVWMGHVLFSLPAGKSAADIARLELRVPRSTSLAASLPTVQVWLDRGAIVLAVLMVLLWITPASLAVNILPGLAISAAMLGGSLAGAELYMRATGKFPRTAIAWPATFTPAEGVVFKPHAVVRYTDGFEFWTQDRTNSLGFMDAEPAIPKPPGRFRILLVGDSIVEALQVPLAEKVQTLLDAAYHSEHGDKVDVFAVSRSGLGQASELGLYNAHRDLKPDLVILMFVGNDFANNSILLESLRSGFSPDHPPWWFPVFDEDNRCTMRPPSADWDKFVLANQADRIARLRAMSPENAKLLDGLLPDYMDAVFYRSGPLPEIYQQAVRLTRCSLSLWKEAAARDGFRLLIVATDSVTLPSQTGQIERLRAISDELQIPLYDLSPDWARHGDIDAGRFVFDGHWNATGHRWTAEALFEYLKSHAMVPAVD
jgi:lysophospholipase L1-like esterase